MPGKLDSTKTLCSFIDITNANLMAQIKQERVYGVQNPLPRIFLGGVLGSIVSTCSHSICVCGYVCMFVYFCGWVGWVCVVGVQEKMETQITLLHAEILRVNAELAQKVGLGLFHDFTGLVATGWRRLVGCLTWQVIFHKRATNYRALLRKMTYEDKAYHYSLWGGYD